MLDFDNWIVQFTVLNSYIQSQFNKFVGLVRPDVIINHIYDYVRYVIEYDYDYQSSENYD